MLLLAVNFCLTTYVVVNLNSSVQMQVDEANGVTSEELTTVSQPTTTTTPPSTTQEVSTEPSE
jgi:hypothetical protein